MRPQRESSSPRSVQAGRGLVALILGGMALVLGAFSPARVWAQALGL